MSVNELEKHVERLRYVSRGDEVRVGDYNVKVDCIRLVKASLVELDPVNPSVKELGEIVERLGYVKTGDIIMPEHHNLVVDALKMIHKILKSRLLPAIGLTVAYDATIMLSEPIPLYGANLVALELAATSPFSEIKIYYFTTYKLTGEM